MTTHLTPGQRLAAIIVVALLFLAMFADALSAGTIIYLPHIEGDGLQMSSTAAVATPTVAPLPPP